MGATKEGPEREAVAGPRDERMRPLVFPIFQIIFLSLLLLIAVVLLLVHAAVPVAFSLPSTLLGAAGTRRRVEAL